MARAWRQMEGTGLSGAGVTRFLKTEDELERIQEKHARAKAGADPVFRPNGRQNKDLEHVRDSIFCQRALVPGVGLHGLGQFRQTFLGKPANLVLNRGDDRPLRKT